MKVISLWQPYATLIAIGMKTYETRGWPTSYRGPLAIHAAAKWDRILAGMCLKEPFRSALKEYLPYHILHWRGSRGSVRKYGLPFGKVIAVCNLAGCIPTNRRPSANGVRTVDGFSEQEKAFGDYSGDRYAWQLKDVRKLDEPITLKGCQGLWDMPPDILARLDRVMGVRA